jgi:hypothetical protein
VCHNQAIPIIGNKYNGRLYFLDVGSLKSEKSYSEMKQN